VAAPIQLFTGAVSAMISTLLNIQAIQGAAWHPVGRTTS